MKVIVKKFFIDKYTRQQYKPGTELDLDEDRVKEIQATNLKLIEVVKPAKKAPAKKSKKSDPEKAVKVDG